MRDERTEHPIRALLTRCRDTCYRKAACFVECRGNVLCETSEGCSADALFDLASVTKMVTATTVLHLEAEGAFSLDDRPVDLLDPDLPGPVARRRLSAVTVRNLLTHSSGLVPWFPFYTRPGPFWAVLETVLAETAPEPGPAYSDLNFMILGELVRRATGRGLEDNLQELNALLGTAMTYRPADPSACVETERGNRIEMRMCAERGLSFGAFRPTDAAMRGEVNDGNAHYFFGGTAGHAGIFARARDVARLGRLYLDGGRAEGVQWVRPEVVAESFRDHGDGRGLGWRISDVFPLGAGHSGFTGTSLWVCPERHLSAALLTSRLAVEPAPDLTDLRRELHRTLLKRP